MNPAAHAVTGGHLCLPSWPPDHPAPCISAWRRVSARFFLISGGEWTLEPHRGHVTRSWHSGPQNIRDWATQDTEAPFIRLCAVAPLLKGTGYRTWDIERAFQSHNCLSLCRAPRQLPAAPEVRGRVCPQDAEDEVILFCLN